MSMADSTRSRQEGSLTQTPLNSTTTPTQPPYFPPPSQSNASNKPAMMEPNGPPFNSPHTFPGAANNGPFPPQPGVPPHSGTGVNGHGGMRPRPPLAAVSMAGPQSSSQTPFRPPGQFPHTHQPSAFMNGPNAAGGVHPPSHATTGTANIPPGNITSQRFQGFHPPSGMVPHTQRMPNSSASSGTVPSGQMLGADGRPNELPVPFHGQGQYSHQVNPLLQKTPIPTPVNSEPPSQKSSRGPSPVSGSTIDALEGQFTPGHGIPSPFPGNRGSPLPGQALGTPPKQSGTPPLSGVPTQGPLPPFSLSSQAGQGPSQNLPPFPPGPRPPAASLPPQPVPSKYPPPPTGTVMGGGRNLPPPSSAAANQPSFAPPPTSAAAAQGGLYQPPPPNEPRFGVPLPPAGSGLASQPPTSSGARFNLPPQVSNTVPGIPPPSSVPGFPPSGPGMPPRIAPGSNMSAPGFPPAPRPSGAVPGFPPPPGSSAAHMPGFPPPPSNSTAAAPGFPPPPSSSAIAGPGFPPPPSTGSAPRYPNAPGYSSSTSGLPPSAPGTFPPHPNMPPSSQAPGMAPPGNFPPMPSSQPAQPYPNNVNAMTHNFGQMWTQEAPRVTNLLNEKHLVPPDGVETPKPVLPHDFKKVNCSPDVFRCTLNAIPATSALLSKARLPLGILIHPFRDLSQLPVIQSSVIVRCRSCRTYINPFVVFVDQRRWKCNLCFRVNDLPDEFSFDPVSKTYGDPQRRPEVKSATIEFIAPSEYMLRPPQPAVYLFLLDVSFNAVETGYLSQFSQILLEELDKLPGDARTSVGFLCYDRSLYYFNMAEGLSQPQMLCVPDLEDTFLPCPDNLLVNLHESKELVTDLLNQLPSLFAGNLETGSALGAALQAAHKMMGPTGGRITVMQTCLPTVGPGALQNRETVTSNSGKNVTNIGPATDFYKKLALDCSAQQIAVDLFMMNGQYADIASLSCISKYSAGCIYYYPSFHTVKAPSMVDKYDADFRRYLTRKIGFESVMRIRCTRGLSIHTFHGNFFVRSTDLLSLPNINPDAGFGMQMSIEDNLTDSVTVSFQAALLYTSSKGERRIRVHTLCVPVTSQLNEIFTGADQQAVVALLAKMAVDRSINSAISDARDAMINAPVDTLTAYAQQTPASQRVGAFLAPHNLRLLPMYMLAMLKSHAFSLAGNTKTDDRVFAMQQCKVQPLCYLLQNLYPDLYPLHKISDERVIKRGKEDIEAAPRLQLSSANIDRTGMFLMDTGEAMYLMVGSGVPEQLCQDLLGKPNFASIPDGMIDLPELENPTSEKIRNFINYLMDSRPNGITFLVIRDDSKHRQLFFQYMLEDRTESSMSYYEFLQFLQGKAK